MYSRATADAQWAELTPAIADMLIREMNPRALVSAVCVGCLHAGAEGWTDLEPGLSNPEKCQAKTCEHCGVRSCLGAADDDHDHATVIATDSCSGYDLCNDRTCRSQLGCRGCRECGDPDDYPGGRDR